MGSAAPATATAPCRRAPPVFALADATNFYASAESAFRPSLQGHPVVVLSNNDGCAISRSEEARRLGIKMGQPYFEIQREFRDCGVVAISANFALYGDMSGRMMGVLAALGHRQSVYSIDECFVDLSGVPGDLLHRARVIRSRVQRWLGLPTAVGMGATKTLSKLANHVAKSARRKPGSYPDELAGVCDLRQLAPSDLDAVLAATEVGDVWGIGPRIGAQLRELGVKTALDAARMDPRVVRRRWSIVLERTIRELQGQPCLPWEDTSATKQQIACTRSFGAGIAERDALMQALTDFASRVGEKLRAQSSHALQLHCFIHTSPFRRETPQYMPSATVKLRRPTNSTLDLVAGARRALDAIYRKGFVYARAGVIAMDLADSSVHQHELDLPEDGGPVREDGLMTAIDRINGRWGRATVRLASAGVQTQPRAWEMKRLLRTPRYTTDWSSLPVARA